MPERVTREEKIIELTILKAREVKALRDGLTQDEMPTVEKIKRPKAKASKHGIKQDKVHANSGGEEFTSGEIKKMSNDEIRAKTRYSRNLVNQLDAQIKAKEKEFEGREMNAAQKRTLKLMKARVEAIYSALTLMMKTKYKSYKDDEKMAKFNEATDREEDPRDVNIPMGEQKITSAVFKDLDEEMKELTKKLMGASVSELGKLEEELAEISSLWLTYSKFYGRSS
jgi:hypothetical protein|tara:strand:- start:3428 stop:4105 length:678 start_codon:yes stop_codon:yes gene_type:complete